MIRVFLVTFFYIGLCWSHPHIKSSTLSDRLPLIKPGSLSFVDFQGIEGLTGSVTMVDGDSVVEVMKPTCADPKVSKDACIKIMDTVSYTYYGAPYTPSRLSSTIEDYHATRQHVLKYLTHRFGYKHYLEIGCQNDLTFGEVQTLYDSAIGVDPLVGGTHRMTSDEFFETNKQTNTTTFDLIFIDGLHTGPQVGTSSPADCSVMLLIILHAHDSSMLY
jgi:hypothetical protein